MGSETYVSEGSSSEVDASAKNQQQILNFALVSEEEEAEPETEVGRERSVGSYSCTGVRVTGFF